MDIKASGASQIEIKSLTANGMTFRCRVCGLDNSGEPVVLLHGFPETSHMWEGVMLSLAAKGYRCLAPDQRGYSPGARPSDVSAYGITAIASDVIALADAVGFSKFHLVGHDWGAACGWTVVQLYSDRIQTWSALSIPHLAAFYAAMKTDPDQKKRSWYMGFFQIPIIPEILMGFAVSGKHPLLWQHSSAAEVADYQQVFKEFSARRATLNWYRANNVNPIQYGDVFLPTILLWGKQDIAIGYAGVKMTKEYMKGEYSLTELDAGHTLVQEKFEQVNQAILSHIQKYPITT